MSEEINLESFILSKEVVDRLI